MENSERKKAGKWTDSGPLARPATVRRLNSERKNTSSRLSPLSERLGQAVGWSHAVSKKRSILLTSIYYWLSKHTPVDYFGI